YPLGIPANMLFAVLLGVSIVRFRLFDVSAAVKKAAVYMVTGGVLAAGVIVGVEMLEDVFQWTPLQCVTVAIGLGMLVGFMNTQLGRPIERLLLSRRHGCRKTL